MAIYPLNGLLNKWANGITSALNVKGEVEVTNTPSVQLTGSNVCLSTEEKPAGQQNDTLLEHNVETGETKVYKFISGDWREL